MDIAIVGAGVGGLYTAWRLLEGGRAPGGIGIFEASGRVGGRLFSVAMPGTSGIAAEFGGMRFPASQALITSVTAQLGLAVRDFPLGGPESFLCLRGTRCRAGDIAQKRTMPYRLRADELGLDPMELIVKAIRQVLPDIKHLEPNDWVRVKQTLTLDGRPLTDWGFWNFLTRFLSDEAVQFIEMGSGYSSIGRNWNSADAVALFAEFVTSSGSKTLADGMQALPDALAAAIMRQGAAINRGHSLISLRVPAQTQEGLHELVFATSGGPRTIRARCVVLALPPRAIELIPDCVALKEPRAAALLATVTPRPLGKVFLSHAGAWWRPLGLTGGHPTTDLPIRQIYYFGTEPERPAGATGLLTMGYFDAPHLDYWAGLRRLEQPGANGFTMLDPQGPLATEARRQTAVVHGLDQLPPVPLSVGFMNWEDDPFGGAWHTWNQGVKSWEAMKAIMTPLPGTALHIVGEAWSTEQGWVEGALQTADAVVRDAIRPPAH
ncbi:MAG TPA: NAD(P)/FAD-dependent oxidoreductase [Pseudolabrys sp.]